MTSQVIGCAIAVHRELGPGFLEAVYEEALSIEFRNQQIGFERQKPLSIFYQNHKVGEHRLDFLVEGSLIVELKAVTTFEDIHFAVVRSYLKASNLQDALLLNFAATKLGIKRIGREFYGQKSAIGIHL